MHILFEDLGEQKEYIGGYYIPELGEIHVDSNLSPDKMMEVLVHEVIESLFHSQFNHSYINMITTRLCIALKILKEYNDTNHRNQ